MLQKVEGAVKEKIEDKKEVNLFQEKLIFCNFYC